MKKRTLIGLTLPMIMTAGTMGLAEMIYRYAFKRINYIPAATGEMAQYADRYYSEVDWVQNQRPVVWHLDTFDGHRVSALWLEHPGSKRAVIIGHGYKGTGITMSNYAHLFYDMGFSVLMPDDRGHGVSDGDYISFGWLDRRDYLDWLHRMVEALGPDCELLLFGTSMGGATVCLVAGESTLPHQVRAIVEDCGYSSLDGELTYLMRRLFRLPREPLVPLASFINYRRLGFRIEQVDVAAALRKNTRPLLVIHGAEDVYVPTWMGPVNYRASQGPKALWLVPHAQHAESYWIDPAAYRAHIEKFIAPYFSPVANA
ncbi:alpha/beta hydrolase [Lacticaseibacillus mingshuiensis]|uniref:Alpha/beta hydrolase n=1 Tax=Lacticaseibacillus mingshuiensis TaxID=2799574 RepID=A0ABW4CFH5_9LACO|nr:alpha/beta hydrolase [Lacticaseibacillus mingshuiensis]